MGFYVPHDQFDKGPFYIPRGDVGIKYRAELKVNAHDVWPTDGHSINRKKDSVLWIHSNCGETKRNNYVKELEQNGIVIDKYGRCGKPDPCRRNRTCVRQWMAQYKFYLAFENSNCEDYITEKPWKGLDAGLVPVVMGTSIKTYTKQFPPNSFLHVDNFTNPAELATHIKHLSGHLDAYLRYHEWRKDYSTVYFYDHSFLWICDICKKIQDPPKPAHNNLSLWWRPEVQCGRE